MSMGRPDKLIINAAITGAVLSRKDSPFLPISIPEIVECAQRAREAGAAVVHLHARNADERPCYDPAIWTELVDRVREVTDLIVCVSLSGRFVSDVATRTAALASRPDLASLTLGSMNFISQASVNSPDATRPRRQRTSHRAHSPDRKGDGSGAGDAGGSAQYYRLANRVSAAPPVTRLPWDSAS